MQLLMENVERNLTFDKLKHSKSHLYYFCDNSFYLKIS